MKTILAMLKYQINVLALLIILAIIGFSAVVTFLVGFFSPSDFTVHYQLAENLWFMLGTLWMISMTVFSSVFLGVWLAAGVTRRQIAQAILLGTLATTLIVTLLVFVVLATQNRFTGESVADNILRFTWPSLMVVVLTFTLGGLGGALGASGFLRWNWVVGLGWLVVVLLVPLGLVVSAYTLYRLPTEIAPAPGSFWMNYAHVAWVLGALSVVGQALYLPRHIARCPAPRPSAA